MTYSLSEKITLEALQFLKSSFSVLEKNNFSIDPQWSIDHLCYRIATLQEYQSLKNDFLKFSELLIESDVNGRPISTFKLSQPLIFKNWRIDLIELPAPKKGKHTVTGFEHFEVVCELSFDKIKDRYANFKFDDTGLSKKLNQELEYNFDGFAVKFHHSSLADVIKLELAEKKSSC